MMDALENKEEEKEERKEDKGTDKDDCSDLVNLAVSSD